MKKDEYFDICVDTSSQRDESVDGFAKQALQHEDDTFTQHGDKWREEQG